MRRADYPEALATAAAPALATLDDDARRAPKRLRPLFAAMRERLFDLDLDLDRILDDAGFTSTAVWSDLRAEIGQPAWSYLRDARLETAARLLLDTSISIAEAGHLVGYGAVPKFRSLLHSFLGMPATEYRRRAPQRLQRAGPVPEGADRDDAWRRMLAGELSDAEARAFDDFIGRLAPGSLAPGSAPASATNEDDARRSRLLRSLAESLADATVPLPFGDQRRLIRDAVWFPETGLFELLSQRSLQASPEDPERGIELALLAVDSFTNNGMLESQPAWAALAWARLARARWWAGDSAAAEQDLERSIRDFERLGPDRDPVTPLEAERSRIAAAFQWFSGRRREALTDADRCVTAHLAALPEGLDKALLLRAELRAAVADLELTVGKERQAELRAALADLDEARHLGTALPAPLRAAMVTLRMRILASISSRAERLAALPSLRQTAEGSGESLAPHLLWFEGHCAEGYGTSAYASWRQARDRFAQHEDPLGTARAVLDLARCELAEKRDGEASTLTSELASILSALTSSPQDSTALKVLGRAASALSTVTASDLDSAERILARLEWDRRALNAAHLA